jgi:hypothetical protein
VRKDSPSGFASWPVEKFRAWSDCDGKSESRFTKDELLTQVMIYWATESIGTIVFALLRLRQCRRADLK